MENLRLSAKLYYLCPAFSARSDARVAEEARLESVYTSKAYPEFESRSLRQQGTTTTVAAPSSFIIPARHPLPFFKQLKNNN